MRPQDSRGGLVPRHTPLKSMPGAAASKSTIQAITSATTLERPVKKARLTPKRLIDKENARSAIGRPSSQDIKLHRAATAKDEKALLDDLMAGLDASVFDLGSSPLRSQQTPARGAKPQAERENLSPTAIRKVSPMRRPGTSIQPQVKAEEHAVQMKLERPVKFEDFPPDVKVKVAEAKPESHFDDELYEFDFDLADLADFDDGLLAKPAPQVRYPVLNPQVPVPPAGYVPTPWARFMVETVFNGLRFGDGNIPDLGNLQSEEAGPSIVLGKTVIGRMKETGLLRVIHLKERWVDLPLKNGDIINVISPHLNINTNPLMITFKDPQSFIIHHPDLMLTMTSIANAMPCPRKTILQSLVKVPGPSSKAMMYGTILHGLLQSALSEQDFGIDETRRRLDEDLRREERRLEVWGAGLGIEDVRLDVGQKAGVGFETFGKKWVGAKPKPEGDLHAQNGETPSLLAITGLHDIEEDIWSPKWGLKGKVDASVQVSIIGPKKSEADVTENIAPLEIKTGRSVGVMAHRAQTMLYTLLMEDRYGVPVPAGLLYYSQLDSVLRVEAKQNEIRALVIARNELAHHLEKKRSLPGRPADASASIPSEMDSNDLEDSFLPPTIDNARECKSCYAVDTCMLYRKTYDKVPVEKEDRIADLYEAKTGHLTERDAEFFKKWEGLLTIEEQDIGRFRSQLWTMTAEKREKTGRCFSNMVISGYSNDLGKSLAKIHRHSYTFIRSPHASPRSAKQSLLSGHIAKGDPVTLSVEPDLLCLSRGFVTDLSPTTISIGVTYVIDTAALLERTKHRRHTMDGDKVVFRIDKDEMSSGMMKMRANLAMLFFENGAEKLRHIVVDHQPPTYNLSYRPQESEIPPSFNVDQRMAMEKVLTADDYALVLGMPGTGKTTTIAEIIKALVERGKSVLLTSYTHSAVDTILMKLVNAEFGVLRLGNVDKVHPDVQHLTLEAMSASTSMEQLETRLMGPPVVAATCLSVDHPLFFRRRFDYCIVDEASQITLPTCLGPLRLAEKFVLVGDHFQLPPIVRHPQARKGGLDISLFRLLSEKNSQAVVDLSHQYRMNEDIMLLSNKLIYEGRLKCGSEAVATQALVLDHKPCTEILGAGCEDTCWIQDLMQERVKAVFVDTDRVPAHDSKIGDLVQNEKEAKLVYQLSHALTSCGLDQSDLAVITPYRQQIKLLTGLFTNLPRVEILTADKSQGRDKECILISLVRSNETGNIGDLLKDWRRINVSFTRAKKKLVIFGSKSTLMGDKLLKDFIELMNGRGWVYTLPRGADEVHSCGELRMHCKSGKTAELVGDRIRGTARKEGKKGTLGEGFLDTKPFFKDVLAEFA